MELKATSVAFFLGLLMRNFFSFLFKEKASDNNESKSNTLPENIRILMQGKEARRLRDFIESEYRGKESSVAVDEIFDQLPNYDWSNYEIKKLSAYRYYAIGNYQRSFDDSRVGATFQGFDEDLFCLACLSLYNAGHFEEAYEYIARVSGSGYQFSDEIDFYLLAVIICAAAGELTEAFIYLTKIFELCPHHEAALSNALPISFELGDLKSARRYSAEIEKYYPNGPEVGFSLACTELAEGNYRAGFSRIESRYQMVEAYRYMRPELLSKPIWRGEKTERKRLLIHAEQGLGDTIMFSRFLKYFSHFDFVRIGFECHPEAMSLLEYNFKNVDYFPLDRKVRNPFEFDCWVGTMSLPNIFDVKNTSVVDSAGYLALPDESNNYWEKRINELSDGRLKVGVAWSGNPGHRADRRRSISWMLFRPFLLRNDVQFFALQTTVPENMPDGVEVFSDELVTLSDTAALINQMDLVITVDTSIVHIAGAIAKKTWLLLPFRYEWRWGIDGEDNRWYQSVRVIRQDSLGDWKSVLEKTFMEDLPVILKNH